MLWLLLPLLLAVLGLAAKLTVRTKLGLSDQVTWLAIRTARWKNGTARDGDLNRVGNAVLLIAAGTLIGWIVGYAGAPSTVWPHVTLDDLAKLGPIATGLAAIVALIVGWVTVRQRTTADRRDQWWERTRWALDLAVGDGSSGVDRSEVGVAALDYQLHSQLAKTEETEFLSACVDRILIPTVNLVTAAIAETSVPGASITGDVPSESTARLDPEHEGGGGHD